MTGPAVNSDGQAHDGAAGVTFSEMEEQLRKVDDAQKKLNLDDTKLDSEEVPEELRGKSIREIINQRKEMENLLRMSEQARQQALATADLASRSGTEVRDRTPEPAPEPQITAEEVAAAFQEDTSKGVLLMTKMQEQSIAKAASHFAQRIDPLVTGSVSQAEASARQSHKDEFDLYADEIKSVVANLPNKNAMSTTQSWDDVIAYVVGKNPRKLFDHMTAVEKTKSAASAQADQRGSVGFTGAPAQRTPAPVGGPVMDSTTQEICKVLGLEPSEYTKWSKVS